MVRLSPFMVCLSPFMVCLSTFAISFLFSEGGSFLKLHHHTKNGGPIQAKGRVKRRWRTGPPHTHGQTENVVNYLGVQYTWILKMVNVTHQPPAV